MKSIERQIWGLQRELSGVRKEQVSLRLRPCRGYMEIQKKEENLKNLEQRARLIREKIRELERKLQEKMPEILKNRGTNLPSLEGLPDGRMEHHLGATPPDRKKILL
jgi:chromosome segregation ATPase